MSVSDDLMWRYLELLSFRSLAQIANFRKEVANGRNPRDIKVMLGQEIVARFHTQKAAEDALAEFEARFQKGVLPDDMPEIAVGSTDGKIGIAQLLKQASLVASTSEALRMIDAGAVKFDGEKINDKSLQIKAGTVVVAQVGKRKFGRISVN
jgi:tyrosyl-tRNA synthetase